ncbi:MAG: 50S ribosomal protein L22 [Planctomycetota bacterium]|nr:50S ribosomal protein L22 [Planctomycetota bacterium]
MAYTNVHRGVRMSAKKVVPVVALIRGKRVDEAETLMKLSKKRAAVYILACIKAARANADQAEADPRRLVVTDARVDGGPTMKRFQPKDRGRAHQILKRTSHITVSVDVK